ncbi:hypothetical protein SUGI_0591390 [Cryptomeria japonica]|uniref:histone-lysine N-methyltransferase ASHH2 n=1 Tax=Cryptomeria japonica TaxID=3369 RepID=UPI002414AE72|nr:histone-lysine N-methyltransferase ASHH2 [Cryptomeria japonica]XP_057840268.1 histone-lysine N-methyltransferase ASHH2 [Cryptomeria japonica]XP_057840269.1 histone-lysine N-methyltransferase ASHH2 [Cryptomeria japonica]XP_057840270.1 histone-lysine N-methyltransferase ASHH2 [Cryptomeria japonica]GLJ29914.1 hypothetical protein SUGI_0591390 [Cryptomeria japonica]
MHETEVAGSKAGKNKTQQFAGTIIFHEKMLDLRIAMDEQKQQFHNGELSSVHKATPGFRDKERRSAEVTVSKLPRISRSKFERACRDYKDGVVKPTDRMYRLVQIRLCFRERKCTRNGKLLAVEGKIAAVEGSILAAEGRILAGDGKSLDDGLRRSLKGGNRDGHRNKEQVEELDSGNKKKRKKKKKEEAKSDSPVFSQNKVHSGAKIQERIGKGEAQREIVEESKKPEKRKAIIKSSEDPATKSTDEAKHKVKRQRLGKGNVQGEGKVGLVEERFVNGEGGEPQNNQRKRQRKQMSGDAHLEVVGRKVTGAANGDISATMKLSNPIKKERLAASAMSQAAVSFANPVKKERLASSSTSQVEVSVTNSIKKERLTASSTSQAEVSLRECSGKEVVKKTRARGVPMTTSVEEPELRKTTEKDVKEDGLLQNHNKEESKGIDATRNELKTSEFCISLQKRETSGHVGNARPLGEDVALTEVQKLADGFDDQKKEILTHENINATDIPIVEGIITDKNSPTSVLTEAEGNKDSKNLRAVPEKLPSAWVQCDKCTKWRQIPVELAEYIDITNPRWCCHDNLDKAFADCSVPQEKSDAEINAELNISESSNCNENDNSDGQVDSKALQKGHIEVAQQYVWTSIEHNIYVNRCRKSPTIDEIMICQCKAPDGGTPGCCGDDCLNRSMNIECVPGTCPCGDLCSNQRFQKKLYAKVKEMRCGKKGYGLRVLEDVPRTTFIIEYVGEVLGPQEHGMRLKEYACRGHKHSYFMKIENEYIDARVKGNLARFINHSCDPNCYIEKFNVNGEVCIGFFAKRDLVKGEELTADYNFQPASGAAAEKCACGSTNCRGFIGVLKNPTDVVENESDGEEPLPIMVKEESEDVATVVDCLKSSLIEKTQDWHESKIEVSNKVQSVSIVKKIPAVLSGDGKRGMVKKLKRSKTVPASEKSSTLNSKGLATNRYFDGGNNMPLIQVRKVQDILSEMLDVDGGIVKRRDVAKHYLKLLVVTAASGDANDEASGSTRDLSMVLDALLKTRSRSVLVDIANKNGFQLLHNMIKQHHKFPVKIPIIRKLLKILHVFATKKIFTSEQMSSIPSREGVESFEESIWKLTRHENPEVQKLARQIIETWRISPIRKSFEVKQSPRGSSLVKANNQTWRKENLPSNSKAPFTNKSNLSGKHEDCTIADCGQLMEEKETAKVTEEKEKGIIFEPVNEWNSNEQIYSRNGENKCNLGDSRQSLGSEKQWSDSPSKDQISGDFSCVQEQKSFPPVNVSEERQWPQGPRRKFCNKNDRWPPRYPSSHRNTFCHETGSHESRPSLAGGTHTLDKKNELQNGVQVQVSTAAIVNSNQNIIMQPGPSPVGIIPFVPQESVVGNGLTQIFSPHMPVAYGIPLELFQKLHGLPVCKSVDTSAARGMQPRDFGGIMSTTPCRIPCEHFSMQQTTNIVRPFHSSGCSVSLPGFPPDPRTSAVPIGAPFGVHSGLRPLPFHHISQAPDNQIHRQGFLCHSKKSEPDVLDQDTLEPEPPVPGLSPPRLSESSNSTRALPPFGSVNGRKKTSDFFKGRTSLLYNKDRQAIPRKSEKGISNLMVHDSANTHFSRHGSELAAKACSSQMSLPVDGDTVSHVSLQRDSCSSPPCVDKIHPSSNKMYSPKAEQFSPRSCCMGGPKQNDFSMKSDIKIEECRTVNNAQSLVCDGQLKEAIEVPKEQDDVLKTNMDSSFSSYEGVSTSMNAAEIQSESCANEVLGHTKYSSSQGGAEHESIDKDFNSVRKECASPLDRSHPAVLENWHK